MRQMANIGFYPENCAEIEELISYFNKILDKNIDQENKKRLFKISPKALIVPHAGWVYSGFSANFAYKIAQNNNKRVIVIGPSHKYAFEGISACIDDFATPCGEIKNDIDYTNHLIEKFNIQTLNVHNEHSTEVQFPFIKHYIKNSTMVELVYSKYSSDELAKIITYLLKDEKNIVIISSDLSHYYPKDIAMQKDYHCIEGVYDLDVTKLDECEACGKIGIEAIIKSADELNLTSLIVDYRTSADASGDETQVVGYMSAIFV